MKKISCIIFAVCVIALSLTSCGKIYECYRCEKKVTSAYYDIDGEFMCKDCAKEYWIPFDYENYKVD